MERKIELCKFCNCSEINVVRFSRCMPCYLKVNEKDREQIVYCKCKKYMIDPTYEVICYFCEKYNRCKCGNHRNGYDYCYECFIKYNKAKYSENNFKTNIFRKKKL